MPYSKRKVLCIRAQSMGEYMQSVFFFFGGGGDEWILDHSLNKVGNYSIDNSVDMQSKYRCGTVCLWLSVWFHHCFAKFLKFSYHHIREGDLPANVAAKSGAVKT